MLEECDLYLIQIYILIQISDNFITILQKS